MSRFKLIKQEDAYGCGLAILAMLLNKNYKKVKKEMNLLHQKLEDGTTSEQLTDYLNKNNLKSRARNNLYSWENIPDVSIVGVRLKRPHWVLAVRENQAIILFDTEMNKIRKDLGKLRLLGDGVEIFKKNYKNK